MLGYGIYIKNLHWRRDGAGAAEGQRRVAKGRFDGEGMAQGVAQGWWRVKRNGGGLAQDTEKTAKGGAGMVKGGGGGMAQP